MSNLKEIVDKILLVFEEDDTRFGGYTATKRLHISAPEDYIESRIDWKTLQNQADDMYYMLSEIKELIEEELEKL